MTRSVIPHTTRIEQAARDACAWRPIEREDPLSPAKGICVGLAVTAPAWGVLTWWIL
jgi:hypothetical protein